ncbi:hypothetical protein ACO22_04090 [Paracoccidioides brasiliensis]|uniref:Uncharacterized protein n=1 Tax=Paracoccidioides brasiliensis TaxID=121759 RepID=A0A1D2JE56_PARBR|nr:hypothetical protein ACO22_04090 [Paracoccidioides brasiliensis]
MSEKRKVPSSELSVSPYTKKPRSTGPNEEDEAPSLLTLITPTTARPQPKSDPIYGQKYAFPGLDDPVDEDRLLYGPPEDGIEYLCMVRSEARTLPSIFVSSTVLSEKYNTNDQKNDPGNTTNTGVGINLTGFYSDGVYFASPSQPPYTTIPDNDIPDESNADAQEIYYNLLHHRFLLLRSTLNCTPPASVIASLGAERPISLPRYSKRARVEWEQILQTMDPHMAQLACMDMESVLGLLAIVARSLSTAVRSGESARVKRLGAWAWGLLGRCRAVGELGSEAVSDIRELGKRASRILMKVRESEEVMLESVGETDDLRDEFDMEDEDGGEEEDEGAEEYRKIFGCEEGGKGHGDEDGIDEDGPGIMKSSIMKNDVNTYRNSSGPMISQEKAMETAIPPSGSTDIQDELDAAKARLQARLQFQEPSDSMEPRGDEVELEENSDGEGEEGELDDSYGDDQCDGDESAVAHRYTRAMLDMVITVVGEFYGQKDLLEFRDIWEKDMNFGLVGSQIE